MGKKKNYNKIPSGLIEKVLGFDSDYVKIGVRFEIRKSEINEFKKMGLKFDNEKLSFESMVLPVKTAGRYSKYNQEGKSIKRRDLPRVKKFYSRDIYPYGDTSKSTVSVLIGRDVLQEEIMLPQFIKIKVELKNEENDSCIFVFEVDEVLDRKNHDFEKNLLFYINLLQENVGTYEVYSEQMGPSEADKIEYVNWELLPPGKADMKFIERHFSNKSQEKQRSILDRYNYICELNPRNLIKGTNYFSSYFGARFNDSVVILENVESGNAIYVFHQDWEELSKLSRTELRNIRTDIVTRIVHKGSWKNVLEHELSMYEGEKTD